MHHVVDKIAKDAGMASFHHGVDENLVGSTFIHAHQHPILDVLGEHGIPVFIINLCDVCQGASETRNISRPSAHGTPTDLQNGCSRGRIPAECLEQKMRRKLSSHFAQVLLYITNG